MKYVATFNGNKYEIEIEKVEGGYQPMSRTAAPAPVAAPAAPAAPVVGENNVIAPMPGKILDVKCKVGDVVKAGDIVIMLEAMKMENEIVAPADGTVADIPVHKGDMVDTDATLVVLK